MISRIACGTNLGHPGKGWSAARIQRAPSYRSASAGSKADKA